MKIRAAVLDRMGAAPPYATSKPLAHHRRRARPAGARRGADQGRRRRAVPFRPVGHQRRPAAADADGARPRGGRRRRGARRGRRRTSRSATTSSWCSCPAAATARRAPRAAPRCASRARPPTAPARCCRARGACIATARTSTITSASRSSPNTRSSRAARWSRSTATMPLDEAALFGCAVLTGVGAVVNTAQVRAGPSVAVIGLGGVGLAALLGAMAAGARQIVAIDLSDDKLALAPAARRDAHGQRRRAGRRRADPRGDVAAASTSRSSSPARSARWTSPTASPAAAAPRSPPGCRRRTRRWRCRSSISSPRSAR